MYAGLPAWFGSALRGPHRAYGYVEAWFGGVQLQIPGTQVSTVTTTGGFGVAPFGDSPFGGGTEVITPGVLPLVDGSISVDGATPGVRRTLSASFAPEPGLWDVLAPLGTELRAFTVLETPDGVKVTIPQGVFDVDVQQMGYAADGNIKVTAPDRWVRVQRARFLTPRGPIAGNLAVSEIGTLLLEVMPTGTVVSNLSGSAATVPAQTWDRDRDKAIQDMARAASLDVFIGRDGNPVIRDAPMLTNVPVWTVDAAAEGVLISADRERNRQKTYNMVVVNSTATDGPNFPTQFCWDANPYSPTFAGPGSGVGDAPPAASLAGPFGQRPYFYSSPLLANSGQALEAGSTILERITGLAAQLTLTAVTNPALDDGDTIRVELPRERADLPPAVERHIVDSMTVPLLPHKEAQRIQTRSTAAALDEGS